MECRDRRLELVRPDPPHPHRPVEQLPPLVDPGPVPARAVLVLEQHELAARPRPRLAPRVVEEHQRQQPEDLGLVGHQRREDPGQADRLRRTARAGPAVAGRRVVALVEDEVEHPQHAVEPLGQGVVRRDAVRDPRVADLALRPDEPLGERRLGHEEGPGDLGRREPAERPQRQRHPRVHRQGRVAAREDQPQPVVCDRAHAGLPFDGRVRVDRFELRLDRRVALEQLLLLGEPPPAPQPVDRPVAGRGRDPRAGVVGHAARGPRLQRGDERVLDRLLGEVEVAEDADQRRDRPALLLTEDTVDDGVRIDGRHQAPSADDDRGRGRIDPARLSRRRRRSRPSAAASAAPYSQIGRTSIEPCCARRDPRGELDRLVEIPRVDEVEPAEGLLRLGERTVGRRWSGRPRPGRSSRSTSARAPRRPRSIPRS